MLNNAIQSYSNIRVIGSDHSSVDALSKHLCININYIVSISKSEYLHKSCVSRCADLLVIDIDSLGRADTSYLCFMATCLNPSTPVVLITSQNLSERQRNYFLSSGAYEIISLSASTGTALPLS